MNSNITNMPEDIQAYIGSLKDEIRTLSYSLALMEKTALKLISQTTLESELSADTIVIDTETTGLSEMDDELLQVSIIDYDGNTLYNSYLRPLRMTSWEEAEAVNHISPQMVAFAPNIYDEMPKINAILRKAKTIIGYNPYFDRNFIGCSGGISFSDKQLIDVMELFAPIYGEWNEEHREYKWQRLITCAEYYGYDWGEGTAHDSLADCRATLYCYKKIIEQKEKS